MPLLSLSLSLRRRETNACGRCRYWTSRPPRRSWKTPRAGRRYISSSTRARPPWRTTPLGGTRWTRSSPPRAENLCASTTRPRRGRDSPPRGNVRAAAAAAPRTRLRGNVHAALGTKDPRGLVGSLAGRRGPRRRGVGDVRGRHALAPRGARVPARSDTCGAAVIRCARDRRARRGRARGRRPS